MSEPLRRWVRGPSPLPSLRLVAAEVGRSYNAAAEAAAGAEPELDAGPAVVRLPDGIGEALAAVTAAADAALDAQVERLAGRVLLDYIEGLDRQLRRLEAAQADALAMVGRTRAFELDGCVSTASWWRRVTRRTFADASRQAATAHRLRDLDVVRQAWRDGDISGRHADRIARSAVPNRLDLFVAAQEALVELAREHDPTQLGRVCRVLADQADPEFRPEPDGEGDGSEGQAGTGGEERREGGGAEGRSDDGDSDDGADGTQGGASSAAAAAGDGAGAVDGRATGAAEGVGAGVADGRGAGASRSNGAGGGRSGLGGLGLGGLDPRGELFLSQTLDGLWALHATLDPVTGARLAAQLHARTRPDRTGTPERQRTSAAQRRHAAFDELVRAAEERGDAPTVHGSRPRVLVLIDLRWLLGHDGGYRPRLGGMDTPVDRDRAVELLHAGTLTPVATWGPWRPVAFGETHRVLPSWLRPLLEAFHRTCRGPGCDRPIAWVDAAHLEPFTSHRDTRYDTTLPLCRAHHTLLDRKGWSATMDPDTAIVTWTSPDGSVVLETRPPAPDADQHVLDLLPDRLRVRPGFGADPDQLQAQAGCHGRMPRVTSRPSQHVGASAGGGPGSASPSASSFAAGAPQGEAGRDPPAA